MKKVSWLTVCCLLMLCFLLSCSYNYGSGSISYAVTESDDYYSIKAKYDSRATQKVERCISRYLSTGKNMSFMHTEIDADLSLDDGTRFYMKKHPGYLYIKFNKEANSRAAYREMKQLGEKLKVVIANE